MIGAEAIAPCLPLTCIKEVAIVHSGGWMKHCSVELLVLLVLACGVASAGWYTVVVDPNGPVYQTSIALDPDGNPHIAYIKNTMPPKELCHAWAENDLWQIETVSNDAGAAVDIAIDDDGSIHFVYTEGGVLKYAVKSGTTWETRDIPVIGMEYDISLVLDSSGNPHICYDGSFILQYAYLDGPDWVIDTVSIYGGMCDIALDSQDQPRVVFEDHINGSLEYACREGGEWFVETADSLVDPYDNSIAVDQDDIAHVSYCSLFEDMIWYSERTPLGWETEEIDSDGSSNCIAVDPLGRPGIAYDKGNDLMYASMDSDEWTIEQVGPGGCYCSFEYDTQCLPHISHSYAFTSLRYTRQLPLGIAEEVPPVPGLSLSVQPNPACGLVCIRAGVPPGQTASLRVYDITGRLIERREVDGNVQHAAQLQLTGLLPGVYFCRLSDGDLVSTRRFAVLE